MSGTNYRRQLLALQDDELEAFVRSWTNQKVECAKYLSCQNFAGPGDMGRDVVGFLTQSKHEGAWHNYQCKQYSSTLPTDKAILDLGKVIYHASEGNFTLPESTFFVAPKGINKNLSRLIYNPTQLKNFLVTNWDKYCGQAITQSKVIPLSQEILRLVDKFNFASVFHVGIDEILEDDAAKKVLYRYFGADPGEAPLGEVPELILPTELNYINKLIDAYGDEDGKLYKSISDVAHYSEHLGFQRERFFDAESFKRFYRDNLESSVLTGLEREIFHGVVDTCNCGGYNSKLKCVDAVMKQAAISIPSGVLANHARVTVKQGLCHHFANEGKLVWRR